MTCFKLMLINEYMKIMYIMYIIKRKGSLLVNNSFKEWDHPIHGLQALICADHRLYCIRLLKIA